MISPRLLFQKVAKEDAANLAVAVNEPWYQKAVIYARAQLGADGISADQLAGANRFIEIFSTLADEPQPQEQMPDKSRLKSYK